MTTKKDIIINTALTLFSKYGYHSIGVDRIRDESQVSKMTMYKYFPSKENLIENVLNKRDLDFKTQWQQIIDQQNNYLDKLKVLFDWHEKWFQQADFYGCLFIKATGEFPETPSIQALSHTHKSQLQQFIQEILQEENITEAQQLAEYISVILEGLIIINNRHKTTDSVKNAWHYLEILLRKVNNKSI